MINSTARPGRFRVIPFTLMLIGALAVVKFSETLQSMPSLSLTGAKAAPESQAKTSVLFASQSNKTQNTSDPQSFGADPRQSTPGVSNRIIPAQATAEEQRLLERLRARREVLDMREVALDTREALLRAAEARIDEKITSLNAQVIAIEAREAVLREQSDADLEGIIKTYERMKPRDAARVFDLLDDELLVSVANGMRSQSLAGILAQMSSDRARTLTTLLAERRTVPGARASEFE